MCIRDSTLYFTSGDTLFSLQKEEEVNPTKKGLMMQPAEWAVLEAALPDLRRALANKDMSFTVNMSEFRRATLFEKGDLSVDIREWYSADDGNLKPGQKGVALSQDSFQVRFCRPQKVFTSVIFYSCKHLLGWLGCHVQQHTHWLPATSPDV